MNIPVRYLFIVNCNIWKVTYDTKIDLIRLIKGTDNEKGGTGIVLTSTCTVLTIWFYTLPDITLGYAVSKARADDDPDLVAEAERGVKSGSRHQQHAEPDHKDNFSSGGAVFADPKLFISYPDPTCQVIQDPDSGSTCRGNYRSWSYSYLVTAPFRIQLNFRKFLWNSRKVFVPKVDKMYKIKLIISKKNLAYRVFFLAFLFQEAWSLMIVSDPDPDPTCQVISDPDPDM